MMGRKKGNKKKTSKEEENTKTKTKQKKQEKRHVMDLTIRVSARSLQRLSE